MIKLTNNLRFCCLMIMMFHLTVFGQSDKFKVVLDAGHGGKDPGAIGFGVNEKDVALNVTLKVGALLAKAEDLEVIYTRDTDVFIELIDRPKIANKAKANLFVSIHCNSVGNSGPYGTETYVMGFSKNKSNLELAKKENSVIYLEDDYRVKYAGFDPNSPETMMSLKIIQEENRDQSISFASKIQDGFTNKLKRFNRGVKEGALWVLHQSVMPSVLIELGFLSNKNENTYLKSDKAQNELALVIAEAIIRYKREFYGGGAINFVQEEPSKPKPQNEVVEKPKSQTTKPVVENKTPVVENKPAAVANEVVFKVQIAASGTKVALESQNFKGLSPISAIQEGSMYKYMFGEYKSLEDARKGQLEAKDKGYATTFIVAFKEGRKVNLKDLNL
uniref:N-acetylmuramoyl-L-alanine amidase n=1 Tax=Flavobacterium sp. TaxID=239 RepID=UPI00404A882A